MYVNKDSLIIDGINMAEYVTEVEYGFNKLWANDSGRNLAGTQSGTLIGIFPKLKVNFKKLTRNELELLAPILDKAQQETKYYDPVKKEMTTMSTYTGDWATLNRNVFSNVARANESFSISFISRKKRV
jgi:hypothetical protein